MVYVTFRSGDIWGMSPAVWGQKPRPKVYNLLDIILHCPCSNYQLWQTGHSFWLWNL